MALGQRIGRILLAVVSALGLALWVIALLLFGQVAENSDDFANYAGLIILINAIGVTVLIALIGSRVVRLIRDYRRFVPGSRLEARVVVLVGLVASVPLVMFYMYSIVLIETGIDEWFNVDAAQGLDDAVELGLFVIENEQADMIAQLQRVADRLAAVDPPDRGSELGRLRGMTDAFDLALYSGDGSPLASYAAEPSGLLPPRLDDVIVQSLQQNRQPLQPTGDDAGLPPQFVDSDILSDGRYEISAAVRVPVAGGGFQILRGRFSLPARIHELVTRIETRQGEFAQLAQMRTLLEYAFTAALSLILLVAVLAAIYAAFFVAQRLISPIQQLMQGTRAVARGDFDSKVPQGRRDEIGFLVNSFNNMMQRLALARQEARESEQRLEDERNKLEVILAGLSTGVIALETDLTIRTANRAAGDILGVNLESHVGESLADIARQSPLLQEFVDFSTGRLTAGETEWREQVTLHGELGNRELVCASTVLPSDGEHAQAYVIVFDDITVLIQAQREAAWGEVARRLAHEIKNPLTPIQLSAERVRRKYLDTGSDDLDLLDRATHTIIQQVDAMKGMVDAFSEYARAPDMDISQVALNELIGEAVELYRHQVPPVAIRVALDDSLPLIEADAGRLRQVMHNLIRNASEAMEGQADAGIEITTRRREVGDRQYVEIVVGDNGPGFAADIIDKAFLPYVTSKARGTGLGLAIVRKLVEEHGGQIRAVNRARRGAEVSILLPVSGAARGASTGRRASNRRTRA